MSGDPSDPAHRPTLLAIARSCRLLAGVSVRPILVLMATRRWFGSLEARMGKQDVSHEEADGDASEDNDVDAVEDDDDDDDDDVDADDDDVVDADADADAEADDNDDDAAEADDDDAEADDDDNDDDDAEAEDDDNDDDDEVDADDDADNDSDGPDETDQLRALQEQNAELLRRVQTREAEIRELRKKAKWGTVAKLVGGILAIGGAGAVAVHVVSKPPKKPPEK